MTDPGLRRLARRVHVRALAKGAWRRMVDSLPGALQLTIGAVAAYSIARWGLGHPAPLIAVTVLISSLGLSADARPRRVLETAIGVTVGIALSEVVVLAFGKGPWQLAVVLLATVLVARAVSPNPAFAVVAAVQATLVVLLPDPPGGPFTRSLDAVVAGLVALAVTALIPRNPARAAVRDGMALFSVFTEALAGTAEALRTGSQPGVELALERLRRTQALVDAWGASLDTAVSVSTISPWLRRQLPVLRAQQRVLAAGDLTSRHLRTITRRIVTVLADGQPQPELAGLLTDLDHAVGLLGDELGQRERSDAARDALVALARRLAPSAAGDDADLRETVIVVLLRPLVVDLLVAEGVPVEEARGLLPPM